MDCGTKCAQIMLIVFNIIFWLSGGAILGIGIWLLVDKDITTKLEFLAVLEDSGALLQYASYVLIGIGAFVLIVGFFGCCGAIRLNRCMLGMYIFFLVLVMAGEIAAGVLAIIFKDDLEKKGAAEFREQVGDNYDFYGNRTNDDNAQAFTDGVNLFQREAECCGWAGPADYYDEIGVLPYTCCVLKDGKEDESTIKEDDVKDYGQCETDAKAGTKDSEYAYVTGCETAVKDWFKEHAIIMIGVGIGIACLELFGFIFAVCLCRNIESD